MDELFRRPGPETARLGQASPKLETTHRKRVPRLQQYAATAGVQFIQPRGEPAEVIPAQIQLVQRWHCTHNRWECRESVPAQIEVAQLLEFLERIGQRS